MWCSNLGIGDTKIVKIHIGQNVNSVVVSLNAKIRVISNIREDKLMNKNSIGQTILDALILMCPQVVASMQPVGSDGTPRKGYAICVIKQGEADEFWGAVTGEFDGRSTESYQLNAYTKCKALLDSDNPAVITSWQLRNPDATPPVYGGGVKFVGPDNETYAVAISGLPEEDDTAVSARSLHALGLVSPGWCSDVHVLTGYGTSVPRLWATVIDLGNLRQNMAKAA